MNNEKNKTVKCRVSEEDYEFLRKKVEVSMCKNMNSFIRKMLLSGAIYNVDMQPFYELQKDLSGIANNINQIAHIANAQKSVYRDNINDLKKEVDLATKLVIEMYSVMLQAKGKD